MTTEERKLVQDYIDGNTDDFESIYMHFYNQIFYKVKSYMRHDADAEDLTQNVMVLIYKGIHKVKNAEAFISWMNRIIYNECMGNLRSKRYKEEKSMLVYDDVSEHFIGSHDAQGDETRMNAIISKGLSNYNKDEQAMLLLKYYDGFSYSEISSIVGLSEGSIRVKLHRIKKELQEFLKKEDLSVGNMFGISITPTLYNYFHDKFLEISKTTEPILAYAMVDKAIVTSATFASSKIFIGLSTTLLMGGGTYVLYQQMNPTTSILSTVVEDATAESSRIVVTLDEPENFHVVLKDGEYVYQTVYQDGAYIGYVDHNAVYDVIASHDDSIVDETKVNVDNMDQSPPKFLQIDEVNGDSLIVSYEENERLDVDASYALFDGNKFRVEDIGNQQLRIEGFQSANGKIYLRDVAGNETIVDIITE